MRSLLLVAFVALLADCKKQEPSVDAQLAAGLTKNGITIPAAKGATTPLPEISMMVFVLRDAVAADSPPAFALVASPVRLFPFDPARAATEGADPKYRKVPGDPLIVPVANAATEYVAKGTHTVTIAASEPVPAALYDELRASLAAAGMGEQYRLVRASDGKIGAERLPPP